MWTKTILDTNNATLTVRNMFVSSGIWNLWFFLRRLTWITFYWSSCWWWWFLNLNSVIPRTWTISDSRVSCIKPWVLTAQRREFDLNRVPYWVHWMKKRLTAQHEQLIPIIWSNICHCNTGLWTIIAGNGLIWLQSKVEEAKFNDVPDGNCDIPDTFAVLRVVTWKIWRWKESTKSIKIFAGGTSCKKRK